MLMAAYEGEGESNILINLAHVVYGCPLWFIFDPGRPVDGYDPIVWTDALTKHLQPDILIKLGFFKDGPPPELVLL